MNNKNINTQVYAQKVELLLRLMPIIMDEGVFAVHGGTAINLFLKDLPRYSVDIDLTYIPLSDRQTSIADINKHLASICEKAVKAFKGMHITPNYSTCKLLCEYRGKQVKVEVNQTKRGIVRLYPSRSAKKPRRNSVCTARRALCLLHSYTAAKSQLRFLASIPATYLTSSTWTSLLTSAARV